MPVDVSMYAAKPPANNLLSTLMLLSAKPDDALGGANALLGAAPSYAALAGAGAAPMRASVPVDRRGVANTVADELRAAGVPEAGIRGIFANVQDESGFDPALRHADQPRFVGEAHFAHGLYQEGGHEWNKYSDWLSKNAPNTHWSDPQLQTRFLAQNLRENYPQVWKDLTTGTPETAATSFLTGYLRPRADYAASRAAKYKQGIPEASAFLGQ